MKTTRTKFFQAIAIGALLGIGVLSYFTINLAEQGQLTERRVVEVERVVDPCVRLVHTVACQARTCVRLTDVGVEPTPRCEVLLRRLRAGELKIPEVEQSRLPNGGRPDSGVVAPPGVGGETKPRPEGRPRPSPNTPPVTVPIRPPVRVPTPPAVDIRTPPELDPLIPSLCIEGIGGLNC